jgi:hypothetical protein
MILYKFLDLVSVINDSPLVDASVYIWSREEEAAIVREEAACHIKKMIRVALIVTFSCSIGIIEKTNSSQFIAYCYDRSTNDFTNLSDFIALRIPIMDTLKLWVTSETFS